MPPNSKLLKDDENQAVESPSSVFHKSPVPMGLTANLAFAITAAALGSAFQHGYNLGVVNAPQFLIENFINETYQSRYAEEPTSSTVTMIFSILVSVFCVGGMIGALGTAFISDRFGRKGGLLLNNVFVFLAAVLMNLGKWAHSYEMIIIGRFFIGVNSGLNAGLAPLYLSEISPVHLRGAVGTIYQLVITVSILVSQVLGLPEILGTDERWPFLFGVIVVPAIFQLATLPFCPESPKYILINRGRDIHAQTALTWLRGTVEVCDEMEEMRNESKAMENVPKVTLYDMIHNFTLRQPLIISVMMMLSQQLSGINVVIYYSTAIFESAGLVARVALYATLAMGVINVLMTVVSLVLVDRMGRRTLHLFGLGGMAVVTVALTVCLILKSHLPELSYVSIVCIIAFVIMFAVGPGSIPWFLVTELFGQAARPLATSIAVAVNWSANFVVGVAFLHMAKALGDYTFLVFTVILVLFWTYTYRAVPETRGRSVEEITAEFRQNAYGSKS